MNNFKRIVCILFSFFTNRQSHLLRALLYKKNKKSMIVILILVMEKVFVTMKTYTREINAFSCRLNRKFVTKC